MRSFRLLVVALVLLPLTRSFSQSPSIAYRLAMPKPATHLLEVTIAFDALPEDGSPLTLAMPAWRTGRYVLFDFAGGVQEFSATDGKERPLAWTKTDKETWKVERGNAVSVTVRYKVYADEFGMRTRGLNDEHAFIDGAAVFMYSPRWETLPVVVTVKPYGSWHVTTGLKPAGSDANSFRAGSYEELADSPIEVGAQKDYEFQAGGKPHVLMIEGEGTFNADSLIADLRGLVELYKNFWGVLPYDRYVFMVHQTFAGGGGTEHLNSTIMQVSPLTLRTEGGRRRFFGLAAHEFFHTWNVKQLRPAAISRYDFSREAYAREYWIAEGMTSYYDQILLVRGGMRSRRSALDMIGAMAREDRMRPGNSIQSLSESSYDAWIKFWRSNENSWNAESDYYGKGVAVSLILDLEIRRMSDNTHSLDDVLRAMYKRFPLGGPGYTIDDFQKTAEEFAGKSLDAFFRSYVHGTTPIPWENFLAVAGLELIPVSSSGQSWFGASTTNRGERAVVTQVVTGSPAEEGGLSVQDEIVAIDGFRVRSADFPSRIADLKPGTTVRLTFFRDERLRECTVTLKPVPVPTYRLLKIDNPTKLQKSVYESLLGGKWEE